MGLLLLLTYTLLSSYVFPGRVVDALDQFKLRSVALSIEPSANVTRGTSVTVRCKAVVSTSGQEPLRRKYTIYKDNNESYTKNSSTSEDLLYTLPDVRVSETAKYKCKINIEGKEMTSNTEKLTVTGLSKPVLHITKGVVSEGEEVTATCMAPNETGSIFFYIYEDSTVIAEDTINSKLAKLEAKIRFSRVGIHKIHCTYTVAIVPDSFKSEKSNFVTISVKELSIKPVMKISPQSKIYEGDHLNFLCTIENPPHNYKNVNLYLSQGTKLLSSGNTVVNHSIVALAMDPRDFECRLEMGNVEKVTIETISVTELFSVPTLTMSPAEVFQKDNMTLTCKSKSYASERLSMTELKYSLDPPENNLNRTSNGVFSGEALQHDFNYTCVARAKDIMKRSEILTVRPKVFVSHPKISVIGTAVLQQTFTILCQSDTGSLPITYTLLKESNEQNTTIVKLPIEQAHFNVTITKPKDMGEYMCKAKNSHKDALLSKKLNATVIVPLAHPTVTVIPQLSEISEGHHLSLICRAEGTPPITFKWYRNDKKEPLQTTTANRISMVYEVPNLTKEYSGTYYCEAFNYANVVRSEMLTIEVRMARWKKGLIGGFCLLVVLVLMVGVCLYFKSKRGKREAAAELSVKPSSPKSDDSLTMNLTHNTEVYNAATVRLDRAAVSVWSERPPEEVDDEVSSVMSSEPDVEYTEVVHPQPVDPARALCLRSQQTRDGNYTPLRKGTDTVYSELKNSPHGAADHRDYEGSVEYAELNSEQPEINHYSPEVNNYQDLPVPVD